MVEVYAALIGAAISAFLMVLANISNRRERDIRELFNRINALEQSLARIEGARTFNKALATTEEALIFCNFAALPCCLRSSTQWEQ